MAPFVLKVLRQGDLCLRDLGYFDLRDLQAIHKLRRLLYISIKVKYTYLCEKS